jgi:hypothetical protein
MGLFLTAVSNLAVQGENSWIIVKEERNKNPPLTQLSLEGNLTKNDVFMVRIFLQKPGGMIPDVAAVIVNVTDPSGNIVINNYEMPISLDYYSGTAVLGEDFPGGTVNSTGCYKVDTLAIGGIFLQRFTLEKLETTYPYKNLLPVGVVISVGGVGISLWSSKISKSKKARLQKRLVKNK